jgi:hypothetical protein
MAKVFLSYSHADAPYRDALLNAARRLEDGGQISPQ